MVKSWQPNKSCCFHHNRTLAFQSYTRKHRVVHEWKKFSETSKLVCKSMIIIILSMVVPNISGSQSCFVPRIFRMYRRRTSSHESLLYIVLYFIGICKKTSVRSGAIHRLVTYKTTNLFQKYVFEFIFMRGSFSKRLVLTVRFINFFFGIFSYKIYIHIMTWFYFFSESRRILAFSPNLTENYRQICIELLTKNSIAGLDRSIKVKFKVCVSDSKQLNTSKL